MFETCAFCLPFQYSESSEKAKGMGIFISQIHSILALVTPMTGTHNDQDLHLAVRRARCSGP